MTDQLAAAIINLLLALSLMFDSLAATRGPVPPPLAPVAADVPLPGSLCGLEGGPP